MRRDPRLVGGERVPALPVPDRHARGSADELHGLPCLRLLEYEVVAHVFVVGFPGIRGAAGLQLAAEEARATRGAQHVCSDVPAALSARCAGAARRYPPSSIVAAATVAPLQSLAVIVDTRVIHGLMLPF